MRTITDEERRARLARRHGLAAPHRFADVAAAAGSDRRAARDRPGERVSRRPRPAARSRRSRAIEDGALRGAHARAAARHAAHDVRRPGRAGRGRAGVLDARARARRAQALRRAAGGVGRRRRRRALAARDAGGDVRRARRARRGDGRRARRRTCPRCAPRTPVAQDKPYGAIQGVSTKVLFLLAAEGRIVRGRPARLVDELAVSLGAGDDVAARRRSRSSTPTPPRRSSLRRWLRAFGPGTLADMKWWTGWTMGLVKRALAQLDTVEVRAGRRRDRRSLLADDAEPVAVARAVGRAAAGARPGADGLAGARVVPRRAPRELLRSQRQHRPDGLVRRADRRRLGAAQGHRRGGRAAAGGRRRRGRSGRSPTRRRALQAVDRRRARDAALSHAAGARAVEPEPGRASNRSRGPRVVRHTAETAPHRECAIMHGAWHPSRFATSPSASAPSSPSTT